MNQERRTSWAAVIADEGLLRKVLTFVGPKQFRFVASVNRQWNRVYSETHNGDSTTCRKYALFSRRALSIRCREDTNYAELLGAPASTVLFVAEKCCDLGSLQWLWARHRRQPFCIFVDGAVFHDAAKRGSLTTLRWARANGLAWWHASKQVCAIAALCGHLDVLKWCRANGCCLLYTSPSPRD